MHRIKHLLLLLLLTGSVKAQYNPEVKIKAFSAFQLGGINLIVDHLKDVPSNRYPVAGLQVDFPLNRNMALSYLGLYRSHKLRYKEEYDNLEFLVDDYFRIQEHNVLFNQRLGTCYVYAGVGVLNVKHLKRERQDKEVEEKFPLHSYRVKPVLGLEIILAKKLNFYFDISWAARRLNYETASVGYKPVDIGYFSASFGLKYSIVNIPYYKTYRGKENKRLIK